MGRKDITINRAPVLTLWTAVVAERLGYSEEESLTLGRAVAGLNAQSKGRRLGMIEPEAENPKATAATRRQEREPERVEVMHRSVPVARTKTGIRALEKGSPISPLSVKRYLEKKFGGALPEVRHSMEGLAGSFAPDELARKSFALYEKFRPGVSQGTRGWGADGTLHLDRIESLKNER